jgi:alginate O-acetyltransferase complex protein AlgI
VSFNSFAYLIFFPIVVILHFLLPRSWRWAALLAASAYFYAFFIPKYLLVLLFIIVADYTFALIMEKSSRRGLWLSLSLILNLSVLFIFKYFNFLTPWNWSLVLPLGLSFHTFQAMSYSIEVYRGRQPAERHLGVYALYVLFFPQLVAGPIERPQNLLPQLRKMPSFRADLAIQGLRLILLGLFKKAVLADRLGLFVDETYASWKTAPALALWMANICFAFQIYYDFSGYTDIARGSARVLGIDLMRNFNFPYFADSLSEFWRRWHISLSTWFKDYVYIPLGGSRGSKVKTLRNLLAVFLLSGLWHGANLTFVVWGLLHFLFLACAIVICTPRLGRVIDRLTVFLLVVIAWIFFRAPNLNVAFEILSESVFLSPRQLYIFSDPRLQAALVLISGFTLMEWVWSERDGERRWLGMRSGWRVAGDYLLILAILAFGVFNRTQFIYFQF